jgi:hypothetical protein
MPTTSPVPPARDLADRVQHDLLQTRLRLRQRELLAALVQFGTESVVVLLAVGTIDYFWPLPTALRALALIGLAALAILRTVQHHRRLADLDELAATSAVEHAHPELGQRLRTALQYRRPSDPASAPKLVDALIDDTNRRTQHVQFGEAVRWSRLAPPATILGLVLIVVVILLSRWSETRTTLARLFLVPTHYTKLQVAPAEGPIPAGTDAVIRATISGRAVDDARLLVRRRGQQEWTEQAMRPVGMQSTDGAEDPAGGVRGQLVASLEDCQDDLEYQVVADPVASRRFALQVLQPLTQESFSARVEPPPYTHLAAESLDQMEFTVVEGSEVAWRLRLSRAPQEAELVMSATQPGTRPKPLVIEGTTVVCDLTQMNQTQQFFVRAEAADGMQFQSDRIRIRVKPDDSPTVLLRKPDRDIEVTPTTEVALALDVSDDFGLTKAGIEYQIGDGEKRTLWQQDLDGTETSLSAVPVLYLEEHALSHDDAITYYAFAEDSRPQPRRRRSELRFIDIRPYQRQYQVVDGNCSGDSGSCLTLEELIARQRHNLRRTFANSDRQPVSENLAARLARFQAEIREATVEFSQGWQQRFGPLPALDAATESMQQAADSLAARQFQTALSPQEAALAGLVKARQNFRQFVKNCSGGQFAQCQRFDNEMRQKLRVEKQERDAQQSLAKTREQLQQLAQSQRQWSEQVAPAPGPGAELERSPDESARRPATGGNANGSTAASAGQPIGEKPPSQQEAAALARQLQQALRREPDASQLSQERMDEIADLIERSRQQVDGAARTEAARLALEAARMAELLDEQLHGLGAPDLGQRLAVARQLAARLAASENEVAGQLAHEAPGPAETAGTLSSQQQTLADAAETLADLIKHAEAHALADDPTVRRQLGDLQDMEQPGEISPAMRRIAADIDARRRASAQRGATATAGTLTDIARALGEIRRQFSGPQLEKLLAAEEKAAMMLRELLAAGEPSSQAALVARFEKLQQSLSELNVSTAGQPASRPANQDATAARPAETAQTGLTYVGRSMAAELRQIVPLLQARIQEAILLTARMDADQPVPARYQRLVEEYYQALSDDLR